MPETGLEKLTVEGRFLCEARIELKNGNPIVLGQSPWRNRRVGDIVGGSFSGPRLNGAILPSGADWSELGKTADGGASTALDVRSVWETEDGAHLYVTYAGRLVIPAAVLEAFRDPAKVDAMDPADYYFRTLPVFETAAPGYDWLNHIVAVGIGQRTSTGVTYRIFEIA